VVLSAPTAIYTVPPLTFQFRKETYNSEAEFLGFELYYKIYGIDPAESIDNDIGTFDQLGPLGFRRINNYPTDQYLSYHRPLIDMSGASDPNRSASFVVSIDFNVDLTNATDSANYPKIYDSDTSPAPRRFTINIIRRDVAYTYVGYQTEFKRFSADSRTVLVVYEHTDSDLSSAAWTAISTTPNKVRIALYALSYGFDPVTSSVLYSLPVYLGYLDNVQLPYP
jgi:hypothetical protein